MIYQKPLSPSEPYLAQIEDVGDFPVHRHYEVEMLLCIESSAEVLLPCETVALNSGELIFIGSFVPHGYKASRGARAVLVELGPIFLKDSFAFFSQITTEYRVYRDKDGEALRAANELLGVISEETRYNQLDIIGSLYKLSAAVIRSEGSKAEAAVPIKKRGLEDISPAIRLVQMNYSDALTVPDAAAACSLSKGNFCTLFKETVGMSFHAYLNSYRVQNAGFLLRQTELSIGEIARLTGFSDIKTFYRVFKNITGYPPGRYKSSGR